MCNNSDFIQFHVSFSSDTIQVCVLLGSTWLLDRRSGCGFIAVAVNAARCLLCCQPAEHAHDTTPPTICELTVCTCFHDWALMLGRAPSRVAFL